MQPDVFTALDFLDPKIIQIHIDHDELESLKERNTTAGRAWAWTWRENTEQWLQAHTAAEAVV